MGVVCLSGETEDGERLGASAESWVDVSGSAEAELVGPVGLRENCPDKWAVRPRVT